MMKCQFMAVSSSMLWIMFCILLIRVRALFVCVCSANWISIKDLPQPNPAKQQLVSGWRFSGLHSAIDFCIFYFLLCVYGPIIIFMMWLHFIAVFAPVQLATCYELVSSKRWLVQHPTDTWNFSIKIFHIIHWVCLCTSMWGHVLVHRFGFGRVGRFWTGASDQTEYESRVGKWKYMGE